MFLETHGLLNSRPWAGGEEHSEKYRFARVISGVSGCQGYLLDLILGKGRLSAGSAFGLVVLSGCPHRKPFQAISAVGSATAHLLQHANVGEEELANLLDLVYSTSDMARVGWYAVNRPCGASAGHTARLNVQHVGGQKHVRSTLCLTSTKESIFSTTVYVK